MFKHCKTLILILFVIFSTTLSVRAEDIIEINSLIERAAELDGQEVTVQGEVIGERMDRGDFTWVNINDGTNAIGIWLSKEDADKIINYGNYKNKGDVVKITGTFYRACSEHGGEADIHNHRLVIAEQGYRVNKEVSSTKIITAAILSILALGSLIIFIKTYRMKR